MIEKLYRNGQYEEKITAVGQSVCNRCLGHNIYIDEYGVHHCLDCYEYGSVNETMSLYRYHRLVPKTKHILKLDFELTKRQTKGSNFLLNCYQKNTSCFLQAVCGAGKTEMTYEVILKALNQQKRIAFILPRVAVLKEVYKRLLHDFPKTSIRALYEGNKTFQDASLLVSTPQQLIYFYHEFDVMIVDEVDAFPFHNNPLLQRFVEKALHPNGMTIFLSATISEPYQSFINNHQLAYHLIPSRYHYRPLNVPEFKRLKSKKSIMEEVGKIQRSTRKTLLFVPTIPLGKYILEQCNKSGMDIRFVHSQDPNKRNTIKEFRNSHFQLLLTTTLLERGVTFSDIDCIVFQADHKVFTKSTLIQISGRVGRKGEYEEGSVVFFSRYISNAMKAAKQEIKLMNRKNEMQTL